jgi:hypothetical protein
MECTSMNIPRKRYQLSVGTFVGMLLQARYKDSELLGNA